jgi:DNA-binding LacI/PurR family transcriptional regulator
MGRAAAEILLKRINRPGSECQQKHSVEPELVIRETTARVCPKQRDVAETRG